MVLALLPLACTTDDGPEYDVPVRNQVISAQLELDADGSPLILAEVAMYYGTKAKLGEFDPKYKSLNAQAVLYSAANGTWSGHSFRNLASPYNGSSFLARNAKGQVQPLILDRNRFTLYAPGGAATGTWTANAVNAITDDLRYGSFSYTGPAGINMVLAGDSGWQTVVERYDRIPRLELVSSTGARVVMDSLIQFQPRTYIPGKEINRVFGSVPMDESGVPDSLRRYRSQLICYSWNIAAQVPVVRKQTLDTSGSLNTVDPFRIAGEDRFYSQASPDSMVEFALRGDSIVRVRKIEIHRDAGPGSLTMSGGTPNPAGCLYDLLPIVPDPDPSVGFGLTSSCSSAVDSLPIPPEPRAAGARSQGLSMRFDAAGDPVLVFPFVKSNEAIFHSDGSIPAGDGSIGPSWIYLARKRNGKWEWEQVAAF